MLSATSPVRTKLKKVPKFLTALSVSSCQILFAKPGLPLLYFLKLACCSYQRKKGSQQSIKAPIIIPKVLAALCSALQLFDCCLIVEVPEKEKIRVKIGSKVKAAMQ